MKARREKASVLILPNSLQEKKKYPFRHLLPKKEAVVQIAYWKEHGKQTQKHQDILLHWLPRGRDRCKEK